MGIRWSALEHERGRPVEEGTVDNVGMAGNPPGIRRTPEAVPVVDVKSVVQGGIGADHVAAVGVEDRFRLPG